MDKNKEKDFEKGWEEHQIKKEQEIDKMVKIIQEAVGGCATNWATLIAKELLKHYQSRKDLIKEMLDRTYNYGQDFFVEEPYMEEDDFNQMLDNFLEDLLDVKFEE